jgi:hypothetical protein
MSNEAVCELMKTCFNICFAMKLSELLRRCAEQTLTDMIHLLFSRLAVLTVSDVTDASDSPVKNIFSMVGDTTPAARTRSSDPPPPMPPIEGERATSTSTSDDASGGGGEGDAATKAARALSTASTTSEAGGSEVGSPVGEPSSSTAGAGDGGRSGALAVKRSPSGVDSKALERHNKLGVRFIPRESDFSEPQTEATPGVPAEYVAALASHSVWLPRALAGCLVLCLVASLSGCIYRTVSFGVLVLDAVTFLVRALSLAWNHY